MPIPPPARPDRLGEGAVALAQLAAVLQEVVVPLNRESIELQVGADRWEGIASETFTGKWTQLGGNIGSMATVFMEAAAALAELAEGVGMLMAESTAEAAFDVVSAGASEALDGQIAAQYAELIATSVAKFTALLEAIPVTNPEEFQLAAGESLEELGSTLDSSKPFFADADRLPYTPVGPMAGQNHSGTCVAASGKMILEQFGNNFGPSVPEAYVLNALGGDAVSGASIKYLPAAFAAFGGPKATYNSSKTLLDLQNATANGMPAIVSVGTADRRHALIVDGIISRGGKPFVLIRDPLPQGGGGTAYMVAGDVFQQEFALGTGFVSFA